MFNMKKIFLMCFSILFFQTSMLATEKSNDEIEGQQIEDKTSSIINNLDPIFPIDKQLKIDVSPVVMINVIKVDQSDVDQLMKAWEHSPHFMKKQPGYVSTQLHKGIGDSCVFVNYAVWESVKNYKDASTHPEFLSSLSAYPSSIVAQPHLFSKVSVPNICEK